jgi:hypothetical protein
MNLIQSLGGDGMIKYVEPFLKALTPSAFTYRSKPVDYFTGIYNNAFANERSVEVALVLNALDEHRGSMLEVGNVTGHYIRIPRLVVVDKYEKGPYVRNEDIVNHRGKYDLIVSISTFEHIGYDEKHKDPKKFSRAVNHCYKMLKKGGQMIITIPASYNKNITSKVLMRLPKHTTTCYKRITIANNWENCCLYDCLRKEYGYPYNNANGLIILEFNK